MIFACVCEVLFEGLTCKLCITCKLKHLSHLSLRLLQAILKCFFDELTVLTGQFVNNFKKLIRFNSILLIPYRIKKSFFKSIIENACFNLVQVQGGILFSIETVSEYV